jgi:four helix bundle suffix protein
VFDVWLDKPNYSTDWIHDSCVHLLARKKKFDKWLLSEDSTAMANCMIILLRRAIRLLIKQIQSQVDNFEEKGGFREKLTQIRIETKTHKQNVPACPNCGKPMTQRKATTGKNAGKEFWGCTGFPDCKTVQEIEK